MDYLSTFFVISFSIITLISFNSNNSIVQNCKLACNISEFLEEQSYSVKDIFLKSGISNLNCFPNRMRTSDYLIHNIS